VGTGIGSSRSLIYRIVANGSKSLLIREASEVMGVQFTHPDALSQGTSGCTASQSAASVGTLPQLMAHPLLLSSRGPSRLCSLLAQGSLWLVGICFMLGKAVVSLVKHKAVF